MNAQLIVSLVALIISVVDCSDEVPVLVWGSGSESFNYHIPALRKLTTSEFHDDFVRKLISSEPKAIAVFVEESLSTEDFVSQGADEKSVFPLLQQQLESDSSSKFLPYVTNPVKAFNSLSEADYVISESHDSPHTSKVVFLIKLDDVKENEDRSQLLKRHDQVIHEVCSKIQKKYGKASLCVLTAKRPSWIEPEKLQSSSRKLLQSAEAPGNNTTSSVIHYFLNDVGLIYTQSAPILQDIKNNKTYVLSGNPTPTKQGSGDDMSVKFTNTGDGNAAVRLVFNFTSNNVSWSINSVDVYIAAASTPEALAKSNVTVEAALGNSFHTPSTVEFSNGNYNLTFDTIQAQYKASTRKFGAAEDTVYFFTIPILSGLFVSTLFMAIILFGLSMIFDIKTMDQFDDPKGKPITINAAE